MLILQIRNYQKKKILSDLNDVKKESKFFTHRNIFKLSQPVDFSHKFSVEYFGVLNDRVHISWHVIDSIDSQSAFDSQLNKDSIKV